MSTSMHMYVRPQIFTQICTCLESTTVWTHLLHTWNSQELSWMWKKAGIQMFTCGSVCALALSTTCRLFPWLLPSLLFSLLLLLTLCPSFHSHLKLHLLFCFSVSPVWLHSLVCSLFPFVLLTLWLSSGNLYLSSGSSFAFVAVETSGDNQGQVQGHWVAQLWVVVGAPGVVGCSSPEKAHLIPLESLKIVHCT